MQVDAARPAEIDGAVNESVLLIPSGGHLLPGVLTLPAATTEGTGVVIIVGGPQYRVGSHRQFVQLARALAAAGFATLRFDCSGMGDGPGEMRSFEDIAPDMTSAIDSLLAHSTHLRNIVLWGLCDAASAALMFGAAHPNVIGLALANPWVRTTSSMAAVTMKHYYRARLTQLDFWRKLLAGGVDWRASWDSLRNTLSRLRTVPPTSEDDAHQDFRIRMANGLARFGGPVLLLLSGDDLTAREFVDHTSTTPWKALLADSRVLRVDLPEADHTFSRRAWKAQVEAQTVTWMRERVCTPTR